MGEDSFTKWFNAEKTASVPKRTTDTQTQGVDQFVAISEDSLNSILEQRFSRDLKQGKDKRLRSFDHAIPNTGRIEGGEMAAPRIQMFVADEPTSVYFWVTFFKGKFIITTDDGPVSHSIKDFAIAFKTDFSLVKLTTVPEEIKNKITLLKPGQYSASQLILGLSAGKAAAIDWTISKTPGLPTDATTQIDFQEKFQIFMNMYLHWIATANVSVLGYAIKVEDPSTLAGYIAPTFPPTKVQCRTQKYEAKDDTFKSNVPDRAGLDALVFAEMCGESSAFPDPLPPTTKAPTGNWIVPDVSASMCLSNRVFFYGYLVEKLKSLSTQCYELTNDVYHWLHDDNHKTTGNTWSMSTDSTRPQPSAWTHTNTGAEWKAQLNNPGSNNLLNFNSEKLESNYHCSVTWNQGSGKVDISSEVVYHRHVTRTMTVSNGMGGVSTSVTTENESAVIKWTGNITLGTISNGVMEASVSINQPTVEYSKGGQVAGITFTPDKLVVGKDVIEQGVKPDTLKADLQKVFNGQSKFVFPGGGDFDMKSAIFNSHGDLLVELTYVTKDIAIEDDFKLVIESSDAALQGKWLKLWGSQDGSPLCFAENEAAATKFQISNGDLIVDQNGLPAGQHLVQVSELTKSSVAQDLKFISANAFKTDFEDKKLKSINWSTTGSKVTFMIDKSEFKYNGFVVWKDSFVIVDGRVQLFTGNFQSPGSFKPFRLNAVY